MDPSGTEHILLASDLAYISEKQDPIESGSGFLPVGSFLRLVYTFYHKTPPNQIPLLMQLHALHQKKAKAWQESHVVY